MLIQSVYNETRTLHTQHAWTGVDIEDDKRELQSAEGNNEMIIDSLALKVKNCRSRTY